MNRRGFLGSLAAMAGVATLDPERVLWVPGKKSIFVPPAIVKPPVILGVALNDIAAGNYGFIQIYGPFPPSRNPNTIARFQLIQALRPMRYGTMVTDKDVKDVTVDNMLPVT